MFSLSVGKHNIYIKQKEAWAKAAKGGCGWLKLNPVAHCACNAVVIIKMVQFPSTKEIPSVDIIIISHIRSKGVSLGIRRSVYSLLL